MYLTAFDWLSNSVSNAPYIWGHLAQLHSYGPCCKCIILFYSILFYSILFYSILYVYLRCLFRWGHSLAPHRPRFEGQGQKTLGVMNPVINYDVLEYNTLYDWGKNSNFLYGICYKWKIMENKVTVKLILIY